MVVVVVVVVVVEVAPNIVVARSLRLILFVLSVLVFVHEYDLLNKFVDRDLCYDLKIVNDSFQRFAASFCQNCLSMQVSMLSAHL